MDFLIGLAIGALVGTAIALIIDERRHCTEDTESERKD